MNDFWHGLLHNKAFWVTLLSWFVAQGAKITRGVIQEKRFDFAWILGTGGMPSSHSAAVVSLAMCMGNETGFKSPFFTLAATFAMITMFDAQTWRRSIGVQARILNSLLSNTQRPQTEKDKQLRELVGHTPFEVFVGALIGLIIPWFFYR